MESIRNDQPDRPTDPALAAGLADVHSRMASRLHSPWWFHAMRGLCLAAMVFGFGIRPWWGQWLALVGLLALLPLARWRARAAGFSRANPDRWAFLTLGAPWSIVVVVLLAAALGLEVVERDLPLATVIALAAIIGLAMALLGPLADRAGRGRMGHPSAALPRA
jgi:hypothetical protein